MSKAHSNLVDDEIASYLAKGTPKNFFLYAGAGAGKTSSLITALVNLRSERGEALGARGSQIGVVTYTNAATKEIKKRLGEDPLIDVATVHSFAWNLIKDFPADISTWMRSFLEGEIEKNLDLESRGRPGTKASAERMLKIGRAKRRLEELPLIRRYTYSPDQTRPTRGGLSHDQVLKLFAYFLNEKPIFRSIFVGRYPVLLVDEVQDTNKNVMAALLEVARDQEKNFALGLFGDTMQRIYNDGLQNLEGALASNWMRPRKLTNFRSSKRIVQLGNQIRSGVDGLTQTPADGAADGCVRLFLAETDDADRSLTEHVVRKIMADYSGDAVWEAETGAVKTLILEHAMAAERLDFVDFFSAFAANSDVRASITSRESIQSGNVHFLGTQVVPLTEAIVSGDTFGADRLIRKYSPLLRDEPESESEVTRSARIRTIRDAVENVEKLWDNETEVTIGEVVRRIQSTELLELPLDFEDVLKIQAVDQPDESSDDDKEDEFLQAWGKAFEVNLAEFARYYKYAIGESDLDTHQGVKGLEFPRVLVILDDKSANGFLFSYEKLFRAAPLTATDLSHQAANEDSAIDRTRRLFYVACSRAKVSLAVLLYTSDIASARQAALEEGWFGEQEIEVLSGDAATS